MLITPRPSPIWRGPAAKSYINGQISEEAKDHIISGANLGNPARNRVVVVGVGMNSSVVTLTLPEINNVTGTLLTPAIGNAASAYMFYANVPTGSSGNIEFTLSSARSVNVAWWVIYPRIATHLSTDVDGGNAGEVRTVELNYPPRGVGLFFGQRNPMLSWSGATLDGTISTSAEAASRNELVGGSALATTWNGRALIGVSFR